MIALLLACADAPGDGDGSDWHLLISSQTVLAGIEGMGVFETDERGATVWSAALPEGAGGFGASRSDDGHTLVGWTRISDFTSGVWLVDASGDAVDDFDDGDAVEPLFPHGQGLLANGDVLIADAWTGLVQRVDPRGDVVWALDTGDLGYDQVPSSLRVFTDDDGREQMVVALLGEPAGGEAARFDQVAAWWIDGEAPELAWTYPEVPDSEVLLWVHGPQRLADGTFTVCNTGMGQIVQLDRDGREIARMPPSDGDFRFAFPRDAVVLPDGDMLVLDVTEVLRVADPFGDYRVTEATELLFGYSLDVVTCATGACLGT